MLHPARFAAGRAGSEIRKRHQEHLPRAEFRFVLSGHLSQAQNDAVASILGTQDRMFSVRGVAGAEKTTTLKEVQRGLREAGHRICRYSNNVGGTSVAK